MHYILERMEYPKNIMFHFFRYAFCYGFGEKSRKTCTSKKYRGSRQSPKASKEDELADKRWTSMGHTYHLDYCLV